MTGAVPRLAARGIGKRFPGVVALDGVDLAVHAGEVLAVVGENGAGKSTLMRILAGEETPDAGALEIDGRPVAFASVRDGLAHGVALIHQELDLAGNLDVAANLCLGREPRRGRWFTDRRAERTAARPWLERVGLEVDPATLVGELPLGRRQLVEIAKALSADARVLIMDEPSSSLSLTETARLFEVVRELARQGVAVVYISHRLREVEELADRAVVLRDGRRVGELAGDAVTHGALVPLMVGRDVSRFHARTPHEPGAVVLAAEGLRTADHPAHAVDLSLRAGEIVGLAGLVGAGRTELLETLFGLRPRAGGVVRLAGAGPSRAAQDARAAPDGGAGAGRTGEPLPAVAFAHPADAVDAGLAFVPEDRKADGLLLACGADVNLSLTTLRRDARGPFVDDDAAGRTARAAIVELAVRVSSPGQAVELLSGGNQQKVVVGKWLARRPRVLLLDEPTRGVDIGAKQELYGIVDRLAGEGVAVLFASSELEEVLGLADRVLVMHEGGLAGELSRADATEEAILALATGGAAA